MTNNVENRALIIALLAIFVMMFLTIPFLVAAGEGDLPPRGGEPPTPTPQATEAPVVEDANGTDTISGAPLQLHLYYGENWSWGSSAWQEVWTEVEWSDGENWYVVEGWRGTLDEIDQADDGRWWSQKEWWVGPEDFNTGPFRWVIYAHEGEGDPLAVSEEFTLPERNRETMVVEQTVGE